MRISDFRGRLSLLSSNRPAATLDALRGLQIAIATVVATVAFGACTTKPLVPYSTDTPPLKLSIFSPLYSMRLMSAWKATPNKGG